MSCNAKDIQVLTNYQPGEQMYSTIRFIIFIKNFKFITPYAKNT